MKFIFIHLNPRKMKFNGEIVEIGWISINSSKEIIQLD